MQNSIIIGLFTLLLASVCGCSKPEVARAEIVHPKRGNVQKKVQLSAPVNSDIGSEVRTEVSGKIRNIDVQVGSLVKEGDIIADLQSDDVEFNYVEACAKERIAKLDVALGATHANNIEVQKAEAEFEIAFARRQRAEKKRAALTLRSPISGRVMALFVRPGALVYGDSAFGNGTRIAQIVGSSEYRIELRLNERDVSLAKIGQAVNVSIDAVPGLALKGEIAEITAVSGEETGAGLFPVVVRFRSISPAIKIGMTASVHIPLETATDVLLLPIAAVHANGTNHYVRRKAPAGIENVPVTLGVDDGVHVEIKSGIDEEDAIWSER